MNDATFIGCTIHFLEFQYHLAFSTNFISGGSVLIFELNVQVICLILGVLLKVKCVETSKQSRYMYCKAYEW